MGRINALLVEKQLDIQGFTLFMMKSNMIIPMYDNLENLNFVNLCQ